MSGELVLRSTDDEAYAIIQGVQVMASNGNTDSTVEFSAQQLQGALKMIFDAAHGMQQARRRHLVGCYACCVLLRNSLLRAGVSERDAINLSLAASAAAGDWSILATDLRNDEADDDSAGVATRLMTSAAALLGATCELAHMQFTLNGATVGLQAMPGPTLPPSTSKCNCMAYAAPCCPTYPVPALLFLHPTLSRHHASNRRGDGNGVRLLRREETEFVRWHAQPGHLRSNCLQRCVPEEVQHCAPNCRRGR